MPEHPEGLFILMEDRMILDYKCVFIPAINGGKFAEGVFEQEYSTSEEAEAALNAIANYTLFLHETSIMPDYSNCGMVMRREGDDWVEIDGDGNEI
jgi:hypothetical protein